MRLDRLRGYRGWLRLRLGLPNSRYERKYDLEGSLGFRSLRRSLPFALVLRWNRVCGLLWCLQRFQRMSFGRFFSRLFGFLRLPERLIRKSRLGGILDIGGLWVKKEADRVAEREPCLYGGLGRRLWAG